MAKFLKGNYRLKKGKSTLRTGKAKKNLTETFEENVLAKLGGSLCFVMKKNTFVWTGETHETPGETAR